MKKRLAESGPELWTAIKELNRTGVVPPGGGVYYPAIRIVCGDTFVLDVNNKPQVVPDLGIHTRVPLQSEIEELEDAVEKDQVEVLILTRPGYDSEYSHQQMIMILHSPSGNSFK